MDTPPPGKPTPAGSDVDAAGRAWKPSRARLALALALVMLLMSLGGGALAAPGWVPIRATDVLLLCGLAITGFLGQLAITEAFGKGEASSIAPLEYTALAWGVGLDWLLWHALPDRYTILGATIIIASGVYLIRNEHQHASAEHP